MSIQVEAITILSMLAMGFIMGMTFDTYQILKRKADVKGLVTAVCDILYWISFTLVVFGTLLRLNQGMVRFYFFFVMLFGFFLYLWTLRAAYTKIFLLFLNFLYHLFQWMKKIFDLMIVRPLVLLSRLLITILLFIIHFIYRILRRAGKIMIMLIRPLGRLINFKKRRTQRLAGFFRWVTKWFKKGKNQ